MNCRITAKYNNIQQKVLNLHTFIPGIIRLVWKNSIARSAVVNNRLYKRYALIIVPVRPWNQSINQSINQSYRSVLFLTWPKQQTATSKITKGEQLKGKTGVGTKG